MPAPVIVGTGLALLVGLVMGLIGAGGSILTVPILVYIVGIDVIPATSYALLVVGTAAQVFLLRDSLWEYFAIWLFLHTAELLFAIAFFGALLLIPLSLGTGIGLPHPGAALVALVGVAAFFVALGLALAVRLRRRGGGGGGGGPAAPIDGPLRPASPA